MEKRYVIDTSVWISYFDGSEKIVPVKEIIESSEIVTSIITVAELSDKFSRENKNFNTVLTFLIAHSKIEGISVSDATAAGILKNKVRKNKKNFSLADALIYTLTKSKNTILITADKEFEELENVKIM